LVGWLVVVMNCSPIGRWSPQRLKNWEIRERKKARDYGKETEREEERRRETVNTLAAILFQSPPYL